VAACNTRCFVGDAAYQKYGKEIAEHFHTVERNAFSPLMLLAPYLPTPTNWKVKQARSRLLQIFKQCYDEYLAEYRKNGSTNKQSSQTTDNKGDESGAYISLFVGSGNEIGRDMFSSHVMGFMFAGHTNTVGVGAWTIAQLANNEQIRIKAIQEMHEQSDMEKMEYLDACMKETIRLYGNVFTFRKTGEPYEHSGYTIPIGNLICISPYLTHHDPIYFPEPYSYNPERFTDQKQTRTMMGNMSFVDFGYGKHRCLGIEFASAILKVLWKKLFLECEVKLCSALPPAGHRSKVIGMPFSATPVRASIRSKPSN